MRRSMGISCVTACVLVVLLTSGLTQDFFLQCLGKTKTL